MRECDRALAEEPLDHHDRVATHVNRGIVRLHFGDLAGSEKDFDKALALDPTEPEAWLNKGLSRLRRGDGANALPLIERAIETRTVRPALALYARGIAHEQSGNLRSAYADLIRARDLDPNWSLPGEELKRYQVRR